MFRSYKWNDKQLQKRYNMVDIISLVLIIGLFAIGKFVPDGITYIAFILVVVFALQYYGIRLKKKDKQLSMGEIDKK